MIVMLHVELMNLKIKTNLFVQWFNHMLSFISDNLFIMYKAVQIIIKKSEICTHYLHTMYIAWLREH